MLILFALALLQIPPVAPGSDVFGWLLESAQWALTQFQHKNYLPACGMVVMIIVWALRKYLGEKLKTEKLALLSAGLGVLASMAMEAMGLAMGVDKFDIFRALANGLMVGAGASGFWSLLGKKLFGKKEEEPAPSA